ncbi:MAG: tRNA (adenosine(37)-N6)-threonylcarbamoyltransferase complex transferase subunit TsaD [Verrucomicrobia bacterium]|nr:tRNA (adenosine(37)-N6)-threonylcarbamoyltransferase complex transferase subunit TsaD [Verrucomicrobiota bacterium]MCH8514012.1 tRNA (adenosine(37)-N6)-threonylcarbamoyltransferase complex transferase subunit TsaD [Kiritimatiellia bacterium]
MRVFGIESSCDETAAAVLESPLRVLSSAVASQIQAHQPYGGVVPELAARAHLDALPRVFEEAIRPVPGGWQSLDAIAVTQGPGLSSSLLLGLGAASALARRLDLPLIPVHHMEGHLLSLFLAPGAPAPEDVCPVLILLVTGGHTALVRMNAPGEYVVLGRSIDDAAGEALDKGARLMGLPYPGGAEIEKLARGGDPAAVQFPLGAPDGEEAVRRGGQYAFSFSGLKTSIRYHLQKNPDSPLRDVAAAYQAAVMNSLLTRLRQALQNEPGVKGIACVGGVAKNQLLRGGLEDLAGAHGINFHTVPMEYCTDNAAMIAAVPLLRKLQPAQTPPAVNPNLLLQGLQLR